MTDRQSGPVLLKFGIEEQKRVYLPRIAAGDVTFTIGMSEPESGSDFASLKTRAEKIDGGWRMPGWTL